MRKNLPMCRRQPYHKRCILFPLAVILLVSALGSGRAAAQTITEIIDCTGDGTGDCVIPVPSGNSLVTPFDITVDVAGNAYVAGSYTDNAFKITPAGVITQIIDADGDGAGHSLDSPFGIAVDIAGNVYVVGQESNNAFKITPAGVITEIIDCTGDGTGDCVFPIPTGNGLAFPRDIAVDAAGNVYVTGVNSGNAFKITPGGLITQIIDRNGDGTGHAPYHGRGDIATDSAGNVYLAGGTTDNAFKITPAGVITEIIDWSGDGGFNLLNFCAAIAVDSAGNVYVAGFGSRNAFKITPAGVITEIIDCTGDGTGSCFGLGNSLDQPHGIAVDPAGNVYVTDFVSDHVFKITPTGVITTIIDATGDGAGNGLRSPYRIVVNTAGDVFVAGVNSFNAFKILALPPEPIPAVSDFGMIVLLLLTAVAGVVVIRGRRSGNRDRMARLPSNHLREG